MNLKITAVYNMNLHLLPPDVSMLPSCEAKTVHNSGTFNQKNFTLCSRRASTCRSSKPKQVTYKCG